MSVCAFDVTSASRHTLGPDHGRLTVETGTAGPAARAGHALTILVTSWSATVTLGQNAADSALTLSADPHSLAVIDGRGGPSPLSDEDKAGIASTIRDEILGDTEIRFASSEIARGASENEFTVSGTLELAGASRSITFSAAMTGAGTLTATASLRQTDFGIKPYSILFGTLRVADELTVSADVRLPGAH